MKEVERLPLKNFTKYCMSIARVPSSYLSGLTFDEQILWLCSFLTNQVIPTVNNNAEVVEEIQELYQLLKDYVDNYFDNLDIQEEVNTKLEEMAQSGELAELISQYLEAQIINGFNTCSSLASAEFLEVGTFARTMGRNTYNDGYGAFYKIRERLNTDVPDGYNIIEITSSENLIAEKLDDSNLDNINDSITNIQGDIGDINDDISDIEGDITLINSKINNITNKKWLIIGDSYCQGYSPDGNTTSWSILLRSLLNIDSDNWIIADHGGSGFASTGSYPFNTIIQNLTGDNDITDILIAGGYNDLSFGRTSILQGISDVHSSCTSKFPNAKIHCAFIGGTTNEYHGNIHLVKSYYMEGFSQEHFNYLPNCEYVMYNESLFSSDKIHPNQTGQNMIANALYQALNDGYTYTKFVDIVISRNQGIFTTGNDVNLHLYSNNNISYLSNYSGTAYMSVSPSVSFPSDRYITIGKIASRNGIIGTNSYTNMLMGDINKVILQTLNGYFNCDCKLIVDKDGYVKIYIMQQINDSHNGYTDFGNIIGIQIPQFTLVYPTDVL